MRGIGGPKKLEGKKGVDSHLAPPGLGDPQP